ncbi:3-keto-disaccharide hydrolase [Crateriforma conspicua]|uniref:3-keto-alpha-glucoside-1,2-lyase/3-keto-2-hydroxy-glucal hydratase domain-containing protein n=1 Tax=Crateriforma conspicua TaxID=2527996 RepID=A0A5C5YDW9_9PLAN|nr:DUF1080 domain-containing protein [Crateriforma conspicua]QDV61253.1 hypothetical protein Mal65_03760 [Crateriforma conspicua]TWT72495.1 hypothetical protein Pan14r_48150 [Crateriforma conspicua]
MSIMQRLTPFCPLVLCLAMTSISAGQDTKAVSLFDGKTLDGWTAYLFDSQSDPADTWKVDDGVIVCTGDPMGYLQTDKSYKDFRLTLQYRWPKGSDGGNSGLLLRMSGDPPSFLTKCTEVQLMHDHAGDVWGFYGFHVDGDPQRLKKVTGHEVLGDFQGLSHLENAEKPVGQWNRLTVRLKDGKMVVRMNGKKVNVVDDVEDVAGTIGLQAEGAEIHFRGIELTPLAD